MLPTLKIGTVFGIRIYLHWTTVLLLPLWVVFSTANREGPGPVFYLALTAAVFACVILHELGHALAARCFGIGTRDITMYPIGGVARLERMSDRPLEELAIAVAGPAVNLVIALVLGMGVVAGLVLVPELMSATLPGQFLIFLLVSNIILVVFNMIPAFPMDGGRVLRALLAIVIGRLQATRIAAALAAVLAVVMGLAGLGAFAGWIGPVFNNPLLVLLAGFVFLMGQRELQMVEHRERLRWQEPLEVLPARRPAVMLPPLDWQPAVVVYTWDSVNGTWVREGPRQPTA